MSSEICCFICSRWFSNDETFLDHLPCKEIEMDYDKLLEEAVRELREHADTDRINFEALKQENTELRKDVELLSFREKKLFEERGELRAKLEKAEELNKWYQKRCDWYEAQLQAWKDRG